MSDAYGIDFGTTNSVLARATSTVVETVPLDEHCPKEWAGTGLDHVLPSVIAFQNGQPRFGWRAKTQPQHKLEAVKRLLATDDEVRIADYTLNVEEAAATFFRHIQERAAASGLIGRLDHAVVTVPANSRGLARYRTKLSAGLAGIQVMALINEPTAAAMAHARVIAQNQRILVFDWGGGTLDVTVLESFEGTFIEQASKGKQRLGGIDIDNAFLAAVLPRIPAASSWSEAERNRFKLDLERAKIELSSRHTAQVRLPEHGRYLEVTREELEQAARPLVEETREPVEVCLRESPGRIDHLVMAGGSAKLPAVQRLVSEVVGIQPSTHIDPMTAIAEGAAIAAGILQGAITDLDFHVGTEHALGTIVHNDYSPKEGDFSVLIRRNTKYPARATEPYLPAQDFQEKVNLQVIEGDPTKPIGHEDNVVLMNWSIELPEKRLKDDAAFDITYDYDLDGILHVKLRDRQTGKDFMKEELAFGASRDRAALPRMRKRIDDLMSPAGEDAGGASPTMSAAAAATVRKARDKVAPFLPDVDRERLEQLAAALEAAPLAEETSHLDALERELRNHAYLL